MSYKNIFKQYTSNVEINNKNLQKINIWKINNSNNYVSKNKPQRKLENTVN